MAKIKDFATGYTPQHTKNIVDLEAVSVDVEIEDDSFMTHDENGEEKEVKQKVIIVDGEKYRVPISVISQLKTHLEENPKLQKFRVKKSGEGLKTQYTLIPLL
jgi:hypothetical protein